MRYRTLGRTGLRVSEISLGTVEIGLDYGIGPNGQAHRPPESEAARLLLRALELGINFIDTARVYGESESIIGRVLRDRRKEFILCSKVLPYTGEPPESLREKVTASVETSLRALQTDVIDIMMIHSAPTGALSDGTMIEVLEKLKRQGKFLWIGASVYGEDASLMAIDLGTFDCLQVAHSAIDRRQEARVWPEAERHGVGIVARSVLLKGVLSPRHEYLPEHLSPLKIAAGRLNTLAVEAGISLPELAYRYSLSHMLPQTALVGASSVDELEASVRFAQAGPLPSGLIAKIREVQPENETYLNPATWGVD
jgi:aryl-alcohol dehydrogenase-like predicted oxidoreductase